MNDTLYFLDVNIPMYAAGEPHPCQDPCRRIMQAVGAGRLAVAIDTEIIQEILYRFGALRRWDIAVAMSSDLLTLTSVVLPVTAEDMQLTIDLFDRYSRRGVTARDLIHAATMRNNGIAEILSVDPHFDQIEGLTRHDPRAFRVD